MMTRPERSPERDAAIDALLQTVPFAGWTVPALREAAGTNADLLFLGGLVDMIEAYCDLADRRMEEGAAALDLQAERLPARVRAVIALRLAQNRPQKEAIRRALGILCLPANTALAARCTALTVGAIWYAAGDRSADVSWYTKRAILAGVYGATLLFWLRDDSEGDQASLQFLDRRLAGVGRIGRARKRGDALLQRFRPRPAA